MRLSPKALLPLLTLTLASCAHSQSTKAIQLTPALTPLSSGTSPTTSGTKFVACSSLSLGKASSKDTTETLAWLLPLVETVKASCGK